MASNLTKRAKLGLPFAQGQVFRRALMYLPWRLFVRPQVGFNTSVAEAIMTLEKTTRRLERRIEEVAQIAEAAREVHHDAAAIAVREQLYDTEGDLRGSLSDLQMQLAQLKQALPPS